MFCPNCGAEINDNADVCLSCGKSVKKETGEEKSKVVAGLIGLFFGTLGIHNFYLGFTGKGVVQLCLTLLTCGIGALITAPWSLIESIMLFCGSIKVDAKGNPIK